MAFSGATTTTLVAGEEVGLSTPSGIAVRNNQIFVTDYATGRLFAFAMDGSLLDYLDVAEPNALMGITFGQDGALYVIDNAKREVLRISAL